ncbi:MAG: hypothetical protein ACRENA_09630 [Vulcanimicrobiaceae bacterium]
MVTLRELIDRFTTWLASLDETRGKWENPLAKLTGREFYALAGVTTLALVLMLMVAWRSGVNAGVGQLPYKAAASTTNTGGTSAYAPTVQNDISAQSAPAGAEAQSAAAAPATQANAGTSSQRISEQAKP